MIMAHRRDFGWKLSIRRVMQQIGSIFIDFLRRLHMSSLLGGSLISPTSGSLVVSVSYTRRKDLANLKVDVMRVSFLVMHQTPKHIEYSEKHVYWRYQATSWRSLYIIHHSFHEA
jgi:hypothetical protein